MATHHDRATLWHRVTARVICIVYLIVSLGSPGLAMAQNGSAAEKTLEGAVAKLDRMTDALDLLAREVDGSRFDLDALATKLGADPRAMFLFVRDQTRYEPYYGVLRGAQGVLIGHSGNALDRSLLLAALLAKTGLTVEIAAGTLPEAQARKLVDHLFDPVPVVAPAWSDSSEKISAVANRLGVSTDEFKSTSDALRARAQKAEQETTTRVEIDSNSLAKTLADASILLPGATTYADLMAEVQEHYWVRYRDSSGRWIDLDPAFPDAVPEHALTSAESTFAPDAVSEDRYHRLGIKVTLRIAATSGDKDTSLSDEILIDQDFRVADRQSVRIVVANEPSPSLESILTPGRSQGEAISEIQEYATILQVGDQRVVGRYFDLNGHFYSSAPGTDEGNAERLAARNASGLQGATSGLDKIFGGGKPTPVASTRILGEWVDYHLTSPGQRGTAPHSRSFRRDIIAPETVTAWSADKPSGTTVPTRLTPQELQRRLLWSADLLPVTSRLDPDYVGYLQLAELRGGRNLMVSIMRRALGLPPDGAPAPAPGRPLSTLQMAMSAMAGQQAIMAVRFPDMRAYPDRPDLVAFERGWRDTPDARFSVGYDIVSWSPRVVERQSSVSASPGQSPMVRTLAGVLATRLEWALMEDFLKLNRAPSDPPPVILNTTEVFRAANEQAIPINVLKPGPEGLSALAQLDLPVGTKTEMATSLARGDILVTPVRAVAINGKAESGWWRISLAAPEVIGVVAGGRGAALTEKELVSLRNWQVAAAMTTFYSCLFTARDNDRRVSDAALAACAAGAVGAYFGAGSYASYKASALIAIMTAIAAAFLYKVVP